MDSVDIQSFRQKVVSGFLWQGGGSLFSQIISWVITIFVIRLLSPGDYGLMAMAYIFMEFMIMIGELGLGAAIVQLPRLQYRELRQIFGLVILINLLECTLLFFGAPLASAIFNEPRLVPILRVLSINFVIMSFYILPQSLLVRDLDFRKKVSVDFCARTTSALTALVLAILGLGFWALVIASIALHLVQAFAYNIMHPMLIWPKFSFANMNRFLRFGTVFTGNRILFFLYSQSDKAIAGRMLGKELLGLYSVALNLAGGLLDKVAPVIIQVSFPAFSRIQSDVERVRRNVLKAIRLGSIVFFPAFLGMAAVAPHLIPLLLGPKWAKMVVPFQLICLILPLKAFDPVVSPAVLGIGKPGVIFVNQAIAFAIMPIAFLIGVHDGINGLCLAWIIAYPLVFLLTTFRNLKVLGIPFLDFISEIKFAVASSLVMTLAVMTISHVLRDSSTGAMILAISISSGILIYVFMVCTFNPSLITEFRQIFVPSREPKMKPQL